MASASFRRVRFMKQTSLWGMIYSRPASGMVFTKPRLAGPSRIIIQQDRRFGNTFGNGFEIAVQLDITDCTFLSWVLYLIFIPALYEMPGSCLQTSPMQPPDHLKCDLMFCCQRFFQSEENNAAAQTRSHPKPCSEQTRRNCVNLTQFLLVS